MKLIFGLVMMVAAAQQFPSLPWRDAQGSGAPTFNCAVGQRYFRTDAAAGQNVYLCTATNTWTQVSSGIIYAPTRTSDTVLTLPAIAANTMAVSSYVCPSAISAGATFTVSSGTGTLWVALGSDCTVKVRHNVVASCSAGCTAIGGASGFEPSDLPLYEWTVTSGALASTGTAKLVAHRALGIAAGSNVSLATTNGVTTISAAGGGDVSSVETSSTDSQLLGFDGTSGKSVKKLTLSGVLKSASGVPSVVSGSASDCVKVDGSSGSCGGGGISTSATALPTTCTEGGYYDISLAAGRSLWRCRATNNWAIVSPSNGLYFVEDFLMSSGDPTISGDVPSGWNKGAGGVPTHTRGGTFPNIGTMAIATGASNGDRATINSRAGGASGVTASSLLGTFYFEATWKLSRATDVKLLVGFQDVSATFLQYHEFVGIRYEAAGSAGVFKYTCQNTSTAYGSVAASSAVTATANFHTVRMWRVNAGTLYMSIDGEAPVSVSTAAFPTSVPVMPFIGVQSDTTSAVTITFDRIVFWSGATAR